MYVGFKAVQMEGAKTDLTIKFIKLFAYINLLIVLSPDLTSFGFWAILLYVQALVTLLVPMIMDDSTISFTILNDKGENLMNKAIFAVLGLFVMAALSLVGIAAVSYISAANYGNEAEQEIKAAWQDNKQIRGMYAMKVMEIASVPRAYAADLEKVVGGAISSRYGKEGSKAVFQWIQEQNPNVDASLYKQVQQVMEAGRNEFQAKQTKLLDIKRAYETNLGYVWRGFWLKLAGYPKIDLEKYNVITSEDAEAAFAKGTDSAIQMK